MMSKEPFNQHYASSSKPEMTDDEDESDTSVVQTQYKEAITPISNIGRQQYDQKSMKFWFYSSILALLIALLGYFAYNKIYTKEECPFKKITPENLATYFTSQSKDLAFVTEIILEEERNSVDSVVLLHSEKGENTAECLATQLAKMFAHRKRNDCNITTMSPNDVNTDDDFGTILNKYNDTAAVTVVSSLLKISPNSAQIFHTMCDDMTPRKIPSLFVFTLMLTDEISHSPVAAARNVLLSAWHDLPDNVLEPLLTRILGYVIPIKPEKKLPC